MARGPRVKIQKVKCTCAACGAEFKLYPSELKKKQERNHTDFLFCSNACLWEWRKKTTEIKTLRLRKVSIINAICALKKEQTDAECKIMTLKSSLAYLPEGIS